MYERNENDINELLNWIVKQKCLPTNLTKDFIYTFLLGCDGDKAKAKKVISNYFYARQSIPEIFTQRDPLLKENIEAWKSSVFVPLQGKQDDCRVFLGASLAENYDFAQFVKQVFMCFDLLISNNEWGNGNRVLIFSYDKVKYQNLSSFNIYITRKTAECGTENCLPGKMRALHNVHIPPFMKKIHDRFKPFLTMEDQNLVMFHKTLKSLHKYVDPEILPLEFGGRAGPFQEIIDRWWDVLIANRDFFIQEEQRRMEETRVKV